MIGFYQQEGVLKRMIETIKIQLCRCFGI